MKIQGYGCDVCQQPHEREANGWFLITRGAPEIIIRPWHGAMPEDIESADNHVCGASCLLKKISELIAGKKTLEAV